MSLALLRRDLRFLVETLLPGYRDQEEAIDLLSTDSAMIVRMLDDERLFRRVVGEEEVMVRASPWLFFTVLLRRARRELERESFTVEQRARQRVVLFDAGQVTELVADDAVLDYLATMLASFTRVESVTVRYQVREGLWRRFRVSELDVDGMMRYAQAVEAPQRYVAYRRVADVCLFTCGMFPEYIETRRRYPASGQARPGVRGRICVTLEDHEAHGRAFYQLAAEQEAARAEGLDGVLSTLSERFVLAEKPLRFLSDRYLQFSKHRLFDV
ncbi:MAG: hypothetical protein JXA09_04455 [Anaerolineae bacterium]|nr:hypothetical protein [Anaerolineae bacterium]